MARKAFMIDSSRCTACRSCQVACKQWNKLPADAAINWGSYENPPSLTAHLYNKIEFIEKEQDGKFKWLFLNQRCLHCGEAGCLKVCPSTGALFRTEEGLIGFNKDKCISCKYCVNGCPFDVPRYDAQGKITKCHGCIDRVAAGLQPACVKACPTGSLKFGDRDKLISEAELTGLKLYGDKALSGLGAMYLLEEKPQEYRLAENPNIPQSIFLWKDVIKPLGILGFWGAIGAVMLHYVTVGPKRPDEDDSSNQNQGGEKHE
ncbi:MAG: 4Fe-4S dicluster domain-containing protein [Deltaproteobacteria bacterium]|nr:4Fe-4S dicluster domain-containing protein [Deltaproteobacteria bacterium]